MRSSHGKGEYAPHGALLCRRRAMGSNDLLPYAPPPTLRKLRVPNRPLHRPHLRRHLRRPHRLQRVRHAHRLAAELRGRRLGRPRRRIRGLRIRRARRRLGGGRPGRFGRPRRLRRRPRRLLRPAGPRRRGHRQVSSPRRQRMTGPDGRLPAAGTDRGARGGARVRRLGGLPVGVRLRAASGTGPSGTGHRGTVRFAHRALRPGRPRRDRLPPSSPMLMQPVDAASVTAVTAAHRTGTDKADNWRTGGTSGAGAKRDGRGRCAQLPFPRKGHAPIPDPGRPCAPPDPNGRSLSARRLSRNPARAAARRRCRNGGRSRGRP